MDRRKTQLVDVIPIIGIVLFVGLYFYSSTLYPGGSQADLNSKGFDWVNNYWCNLMSELGMNGELNPAKPYAIFAMITVCLSLIVFFIQYAKAFSKSQPWSYMISWGGSLSMLTACFVFSRHHDTIILISSFFGLFAVLGIIREIYKSEMTKYKVSGILCLLLLVLNNYINYSQQYIEALPILQKITFTVVLIWIAGLNLAMIKLNNRSLFIVQQFKDK